MNTSLSTEPKDHLIIFANSEERLPMRVTQRKADVILKFLKDKGASYLDLTNDEGRYSETIQKRSIKGVKKIATDLSNQGAVWICQHGVDHALGAQCGCAETYGFWLHLFEWCQEKYKVTYVNDITTAMRKEFLATQT